METTVYRPSQPLKKLVGTQTTSTPKKTNIFLDLFGSSEPLPTTHKTPPCILSSTPDSQTNPESQQSNDPSNSFSPNERKSTGLDQIHNDILTNLSPTNNWPSYSYSTRNKFVLEPWKIGNVIPLLKTGKPANIASSYWPISLTLCQGKFFKRIVTTLFTWFVGIKNAQNKLLLGKIVPPQTKWSKSTTTSRRRQSLRHRMNAWPPQQTIKNRDSLFVKRSCRSQSLAFGMAATTYERMTAWYCSTPVSWSAQIAFHSSGRRAHETSRPSTRILAWPAQRHHQHGACEICKKTLPSLQREHLIYDPSPSCLFKDIAIYIFFVTPATNVWSITIVCLVGLQCLNLWSAISVTTTWFVRACVVFSILVCPSAFVLMAALILRQPKPWPSSTTGALQL